MLHRLRAHYVSVALLFGSAVCLGATVWLVVNSGGLVYFLAFHTPLHLQLAAAAPAYHQPALPAFEVHASISQAKLSPGDNLTIHVAVTPKQTVSGHLEIWVRGPNNREVYKYPADVDKASPVQFISSQQQTYDEIYTLLQTELPGTYTVSAGIVSENQQVDYYNAHNFASFEVL